MKILAMIFLLLLHLSSAVSSAVEADAVHVFFQPEQEFLRVTAAFTVTLESSTLEFSLFPGAQVTAIWIPGMLSYGVDRRPSATRFTVTLRSQPQSPQPLEISYEGILPSGVLESGRLAEDSLWFPRMSNIFSLETLTVEFAPDSSGQLTGTWEQLPAGPGVRKFRRAVTEDYPVIEFSGTAVAPPESTDTPSPVPPATDHGVPEVDQDTDEPPAPPLDTDEDTAPLEPEPLDVPFAERSLSLQQLWEQESSVEDWENYFSNVLREPQQLQRIKDALSHLQAAADWQWQQLDENTAESRFQAEWDGREVYWTKGWQLVDSTWYVTELQITPAPSQDTGVLLESLELWLERLLTTPWTQDSLWWDRSFADDEQRQALAAFVRSIGDVLQTQIQDVTHAETGSVRFHVILTTDQHRHLVHLQLTPLDQYWQLKDVAIFPL